MKDNISVLDSQRKERLDYIDYLLQKKELTVEEIIDSFHRNKGLRVSRRTIYNDINYLEDPDKFEAPISRKRDGKLVRLSYSDRQFSIRLVTTKEERQLLEAIRALSALKGLPQFSWIEEVNSRLNQNLKVSNEKAAIIYFDEPEAVKGTQFIEPLFHLIDEKKVMQINYRPFHSDTVRCLTVHPYILKKFNNRWFLFGLNIYEKEGITHEKIINLALDRILDFSVLQNIIYIDNPDTDFLENFEDIIGVSFNNSKPIELVKIRITNERYPYIESKPLHGSQTRIHHEDTPTHTTLTIRVQLNKELTSLILSFGEDMEVLSPQHLRDEIAHKVHLLSELYSIV